MIDTPFPLRVTEGGARNRPRPGLPEAALVVLAQEVVQRLARWAGETVEARRAACEALDEPDVEALCDALIGLDPQAAQAMILAAHRAGASHEELCLHHIGAAARLLGKRWDADRISLRHMALAAGRMLTLLRDLRDLAPPFQPRGARSALFAAVPGERHVLGVTMAADLFRDDGWDVDLRLDTDEARLADKVVRGAYPIVALSAAGVDRIRGLARAIVAVRLAAPKALIFVGGYLARLEPDIAHRVGADAAAWEMTRCRTEMERLHQMLPRILTAT